MRVNCPAKGCRFQGTEDEVDDHVAYLARMGDEDHEF